MHSSYKPTASALMACAALAGCFGGGDDPVPVPVPTPTPVVDPLVTVPGNVGTSVGGVISYLIQLATLTDAAESREPLDVSAVTLATSDTDEPSTIL